MLCCKSVKACEQRQINKKIEKQIKKDKIEQSYKIKILLLGYAQSGKSTLLKLKQTRIIYRYRSGYLNENNDISEYKMMVYQSIYMAINSIIMAMAQHTISK